MGERTGIEWCESTLNIQMGCDGCELWNPAAGVRHCYAGSITARYAGRNGWPIHFGVPSLFLSRLDDLDRWPDLRGKERPDKPWLNGRPRHVFMCDMGDPWTESLPLDWLAPYLPRLAELPHVLIWLTKRPRRAREFFTKHPAPKNFWLLTSVTGQATMRRVVDLLATPGLSVRGVSYEPALGPMSFPMPDGDHLDTFLRWWNHDRDEASGICWIIAGGESGPGARPSHPDWFRSVRDQCQAAGVPFFFKQWGEWLPSTDRPQNTTSHHTYVCRGCGRIEKDWREFIKRKCSGAGCDGQYGMIRVGKKAAGRLLDGVEWNEMPEVPD